MSCDLTNRLITHIANMWAKISSYGAVVVAQLVERSLPTLEVHGSNPVIGKIYMERFLSTLYKIRKK